MYLGGRKVRDEKLVSSLESALRERGFERVHVRHQELAHVVQLCSHGRSEVSQKRCQRDGKTRLSESVLLPRAGRAGMSKAKKRDLDGKASQGRGRSDERPGRKARANGKLDKTWRAALPYSFMTEQPSVPSIEERGRNCRFDNLSTDAITWKTAIISSVAKPMISMARCPAKQKMHEGFEEERRSSRCQLDRCSSSLTRESLLDS